MKLIQSVELEKFRSVREAKISNLGDMTAIAGLNNSGKSNFLRALNAFFKDEVEPGMRIDLERDYYRRDLGQKRRKFIRVAVEFKLPDDFNFRKGLESTEDFLGTNFTIEKRWDRENPEPLLFLNGKSDPLDPKETELVRRFLALINFRYIPNRVVPTDVIRREHTALRDALVRRLSKSGPSSKGLFEEIRKISVNLVETMQDHVKDLCFGVDGLRLRTPDSWGDILFALGYQVRHGAIEVADDLQGSGIQSLLMLETLSLIDRDFFQRFGWRQAAIWAVEEPESSLHTQLEAEVAAFLSKVSSERRGRLQVIATTHSELIVRHADQGRMLEQSDRGTRVASSNRADVADGAIRLGISRWTHPLLHHPLEKQIFVEGKTDKEFLIQAIHILFPVAQIRVSCLDDIATGAGGDDTLVKYIRSNKEVLRLRPTHAQVLVLFDWDSNKDQEMSKVRAEIPCLRVQRWDFKNANPSLDESFKGIERFLSDRIIELVSNETGKIGVQATGRKMVSSQSYGDVKRACADAVRRGITKADCVFAEKDLALSLAALTDEANLTTTVRRGTASAKKAPASAVAGSQTSKPTNVGDAHHGGQSGPKIRVLVPNATERKVADALLSEAPRSLNELAAKAFPQLEAGKANSWVRNALRRLVRAGWAVKVEAGKYRAGAKHPLNSK